MKPQRSNKATPAACSQQHQADVAAAPAAALSKQARTQPFIATDHYAYDPERAANRRFLAYTSAEFEQLSEEKQRRVLRNRETAQMSKARKRARLQDLQDKEAELQQHQQKLQQQLAVLQAQLAAAAAVTHGMLQGCSCQACAGLQEQLQLQQARC
uniref:BZIP domain-containing protein n=1 Tax=Tetradesmus obliquus TaxID=3088 RepID=A0A383W3C8_TETOB|eukprot:jgi/Sobl393_1/13989/SZX71683.1